MTTQEILQQCTVEGMTVKLPAIQLDRKEYLDVKKHLELIGGAWKGGRVQGFVFQQDPTSLLGQVAQGEKRNLKKEFQFFPTPAELAQRLVEKANPTEDDKILEPSAGQGAIVKEILDYVKPHNEFSIEVFCYELMELNQSFIGQIPCATLLGEDFLEASEDVLYDVIIANPPFTKNQDIDHIRKMWHVLNNGGRIVSMASTSWMNGSQKKQVAFKEWLTRIGADVEEVPAGAFKESGTNIPTVIITINKVA